MCVRDRMICGPRARLVDVDDVGDDAVAGAVRLARHLVAHRQHRLGAAQVDDDVAALEPADDAGDQLALAVLVLVEDVLALGLADALQDDLLGGLRGDAAEALPGAVQLEQLAVLGVLLLGLRLVLLVVEDLEQQLVAGFRLEAVAGGVLQRDFLAAGAFQHRGHHLPGRHVRHRLEPLSRRHLVDDDDDLEQIDAARLLVELRLHLAMHAEGALGGGQDRLFQRLDQHGSVDVLVFGDLVEDQAEGGTVVHEALRWNSRSQSGTRLARCDVVDGDLVRPAVTSDLHAAVLGRPEGPVEIAAPLHPVVEPNTRALTHEPRKIPLSPQGPIKPGRAHFQLIRVRDDVGHIQSRRHVPTHSFAVVQSDTAAAHRPAPRPRGYR